MKLFNLFRSNKIETILYPQGVEATLYPEFILIRTIDKSKERIGLSSIKFSKLAIDSSDELLGDTINHYLNLTIHNLALPKDYKIAHKSALKALGFKNAKAQYENARYVSISKHHDKIILDPSINGGATGNKRGFRGLGGSLVLNVDISNIELGKQTREAWALCKF